MERFPGFRVGVYRESPGSDIIQSGFLKKLKTMKKKFFVLRSTSSSGPARLDYYDKKKMFETGHPPKRTIYLHQCFNINKKADTKHKFAIALYTKEDCFSIVMDDEQTEERWLNSLLEFQNEYLLEGQPPRPHYDFVWQGLVKPPQKIQDKCIKVTGVYRLCLSEKSVFLVKLNQDKPEFTFQFSTVRKCGHSESYFFIEVGHLASTGSGELWMQMDDSGIAESMHNNVLHYMAAARTNPEFRRRSNTSSSAVSVAQHRNTIIGDEFQRQRTASESHHIHGSPRRTRLNVSRPVSTVEYSSKPLTLSPEPQFPIGSSPLSPSFMDPAFDETRLRSDSTSSRSSRSSHVTETMDTTTPVLTPENSFIHRSLTPESTYVISEEEPSDYLNMTPGQITPGHMTPGQRSGSPSPTRDRVERPGSSGSESQESKSQTDGYMDMKPGSSANSTGNDSGYMDMMVGNKPSENTGYMVMGPGRTTAPIPIHQTKEATGYMDMMASGLTSQTQTLPTVKESGSGEAYLPMTPTGQSPMSSYGLKPAKVVSYLSDDSMSGEFPKRAYSVGSRPNTKPLRHHPIQDIQKKQVLDNSRSSSAPHLIVQKSRSPYLDSAKYQNPYDAYQAKTYVLGTQKNLLDEVLLSIQNQSIRNSCISGASPLSQSYKSDDSDSFMEMDFYRPRTASDSYGCRPRASSFGKQYTTQGHRPRSSSYGQSSRSKLSKLDSMDSVRMASQELGMKPRSEESLGKFSSSSRNSSSDSLKKIPDDTHKTANYLNTDYMDMGFEKRNTPSPNIQNFMSPPKSEIDKTGYVDMTLGTSAPKSSRGVSPSSSNHSLGSSPASSTGRSHDKPRASQDAIVVKASGHVVHKPGFPTTENQLKVTAHLLASEKRSPSSSGKESEDESYVPFKPAAAQPIMSKSYVTAHDINAKGHYPKDAVQRSGLKIQHGYSRSLDSGMKSVDISKGHHGVLDKMGKKKHEGKHKTKTEDEHRNSKQGKHSPKTDNNSRSKSKLDSTSRIEHTSKTEGSSALQEKVAKGHSPTLERKLEIPDTDIFSNKIYQDDFKPPPVSKATSSKSQDSSSYMEYSPGFEVIKSPSFEFKKRPSEYMEIDFPAKEESSDYMEADFATTPTSISVTTPTSVKSPKVEEKADPESRFLYMDFDPARPSEEEHKDTNPVKTPTRVQAFISHPLEEAKTKESSKKDLKQKQPLTVKVEGHGSEGRSSNNRSDIGGNDHNSDKDKTVKSSRKSSSSSKTLNEQKSSNEAKSAKSVDSPKCEGEVPGSLVEVEQCDNVSKDTVQCDSTVNVDKHKDKSAIKEEGKENVGEGRKDGREKMSEGHCKDGKEKSSEGHCKVSKENSSEGHCKVSKENSSEGHCIDSREVVSEGHCKDSREKCAKGVKSNSKSDCVHKVDDAHNIVIKDRKTVAQSIEPIQDEGYVDILDFSDNRNKSRESCSRQHHRSGSSSSSNSEKIRLPLEEIPCPEKVASFFVEDPFPMPETPKSYISDDSIPEIPTPEQQVSYIQDETEASFFASLGNTSPNEGKENILRNSGKFTSVRTRPASGSQLPSAGAIGEGVMVRTRSASGQPVIQHGSGFSRQASVPAVPSFSPRTGQEIQSIGRGRKASGPPNFPSVNKALNGSLNAGTKKSLDTAPLGQELTKQNSLPSMTVPIAEPLMRHTTMPCPQEIQPSRHSFTNLSAEYEQMTFPGSNRLSATESEKSSSQQQLCDTHSQDECKLNYAQLDLHGSSEGIDDKVRVKSRHPSSLDDLSQPSPIYVEIDHEKTESLKNSGNKDVKFTL